MKVKKKEEEFFNKEEDIIRYTRCKFTRKYFSWKGINRAGEGTVRSGYGNKKGRKTRKKRQDHKNKMDF